MRPEWTGFRCVSRWSPSLSPPLILPGLRFQGQSPPGALGEGELLYKKQDCVSVSNWRLAFNPEERDINHHKWMRIAPPSFVNSTPPLVSLLWAPVYSMPCQKWKPFISGEAGPGCCCIGATELKWKVSVILGCCQEWELWFVQQTQLHSPIYFMKIKNYSLGHVLSCWCFIYLFIWVRRGNLS